MISNNYIFTGTWGGSVIRRPLSELIGIQNITSSIPNYFSLSQNYPNPFNPATNIKYQIANNKFISLKVFDILGKEIESLVNEKQSAGTYEVNWNGSQYPSGVYFYRLVTDGFTDTKKMILIINKNFVTFKQITIN
ncbi:MAG: T9SS type A sorting domain-containing protein [Ignavibacteriae bacterium]|nr:T9SS type A sorting domain-containing protein [Ignavibacteriota bacterium]